VLLVGNWTVDQQVNDYNYVDDFVGNGVSDDAFLTFSISYDVPYDTIIGGSGKDVIIGEGGSEFIETGGGNDFISSGGGDDLIVVNGSGNATINTGSGNDYILIEDGVTGDIILNNAGGLTVLEIAGNTEGDEYDWSMTDSGALTLIRGDLGTIYIENQREFHDNGEGSGYWVVAEGGISSLRVENYVDEITSTGTYDDLIFGSSNDDYLVGYEVDGEAHRFEVYSYENNGDLRTGFDDWSDRDILIAGGGNDLLEAYGGSNVLIGGAGDDTFLISADSQLTFVAGDKAWDDNDNTENLSYADVVKIGWSYEDSIIEAVGAGYRIENVDLGAVVEVYDVELLKFQNANGSWDDRALTDGAPIAINSKYGDGSDIKFVVSEGDNLQVLAAGRRGDTVLWEGNRLEVDAFNFTDGVSINVINISDADVFDNPIVYTMGTEGVDLIFGNDSDNLIDGKGGDDIIFGGGGNDVIIGGEGNDVITGGAGDDIIRGDGVDVDDAAAAYFEDAGVSSDSLSASDMITDGNDTIIGGDGVDDIESGNGENFVASGRVDLDGDGAADLDLIKEHMTTNQNVFDDDDWI